MSQPADRRRFLASLLPAAGAALLDPVRAVAQAVKPVRIRDIDIFPIEIPIAEEELKLGKYARYTVYRVETDVGVRGCAFDRGADYLVLDKAIRPAFAGKDLFAIEAHLKAGLARWGGLEHAMWDAIGKIAAQPVYRLLGGAKSSLKVYLTAVWRGKADQSHVPFQAQAETALAYKKAGFGGIKIRVWRPNPLDDAEACGEIRRAVGPDFAIMVDRTADLPGLWDYPTALRAARAMERHEVQWLEEPFARDDFVSPARLAKEVDILITGGERFQGLDSYRECLRHGSYDLLQPDCVIAGGIFLTCKIAALAQAFQIPVVLHGAMGLRLAGWLQASAAFGAEWQELALITPPLMPEEQWSPALKVLKSSTLFTLQNGEIRVPDGPGLGLAVDDDAVERCRIPHAPVRSFYPQY
jgi:L-alanine-DL-glutamate epimerase-like enolase superfamily enzyme